jgi:predicted AlkP superfamily pyrophosphatase or phosphodiesterase
MRKVFLSFWLLTAGLLTVSANFAQVKPVKDLRPTVILISLDGFRYDYLDKYKPKVLNQLASEGVRAKWMTPSFPSKTFPNHYTIATGLYPAHHGIVENNVYDFGETFKMDKRSEVLNPRWWLGEPIWVTAEKQGQIAGSYFFVGTGTMIEGRAPTYWREYNGEVPPQMRVDKTLAWFDLPVEKRPTMISMYFSDTDDAGHAFSPDSEELGYAIQNVDGYIGRLMTGLKLRGIDQKVNIIIVSDHGMARVDPKNAVFLDDHFDVNDKKIADPIIWTNEIVQIFPKPGMENKIMDSLKGIKHTSCWRKKDIPERFHYKDGPRVAPIICSSDEGWATTTHKKYDDWNAEHDMKQMRGAHGYDNELVSMGATFIAHGSAFKKHLLIEPFQNIQVYNVMTRILNLKPAKNDGDFKLADQILKKN